MKKRMMLMLACCMVTGLAACGPKEDAVSLPEPEPIAEDEPVEEDQPVAEPAAETALITEEQALEAVRNYCFIENPDLKDMVDSDDYTIYWEVSTNDKNEIVVLYRSYTAAEIRYYIDPESGSTYTTELVPGIIDEEQRTEETLNIRDYME